MQLAFFSEAGTRRELSLKHREEAGQLPLSARGERGACETEGAKSLEQDVAPLVREGLASGCACVLDIHARFLRGHLVPFSSSETARGGGREPILSFSFSFFNNAVASANNLLDTHQRFLRALPVPFRPRSARICYVDVGKVAILVGAAGGGRAR